MMMFYKFDYVRKDYVGYFMLELFGIIWNYSKILFFIFRNIIMFYLTFLIKILKVCRLK